MALLKNEVDVAEYLASGNRCGEHLLDLVRSTFLLQLDLASPWANIAHSTAPHSALTSYIQPQ